MSSRQRGDAGITRTAFEEGSVRRVAGMFQLWGRPVYDSGIDQRGLQ